MSGLSRLALLRTDRLGDLLMNVPLMRRLRQNYPKSHITVVCRAENAELLRHQPDIDEVVPLSDEDLAARAGQWRLFNRLRTYRFDGIVVSNPAKLLHLMAFALGARVRAGWRRKWGVFLNRPAGARTPEGHEIDFNLSLADSFCSIGWDGRIELGVERHPAVERILHKFGVEPGKAVGVHPLTSDPRKEWPLEKFGAVIREVLRHSPHPVLLLGKGDAKEMERRLGVGDEPNFRNLVGQTSLIDAAVLLKNSRCLVSLDSGPYHLAWMQKVPVVGLFLAGAGASNPVRWGAYPGFSKAVNIHKSSAEITEGEVVDAVYECLTERVKSER